MTILDFPRSKKFGFTAVLLIALAMPMFAISSYEGTVDTSASRWLALYLVGTEAAIILIAVFSGWSPVGSFHALPRYVRTALILWLFVASLATAFSTHFWFSALFQLFWIIHGVFSWALWAMLKTKWAGWERSLLVYTALGLLVHSLLVYFVAWIALGLDLDTWEPYSVGTTNPRLYIFYAAALLGMGLGFLITSLDKQTCFLGILLTFAAYHLFAWSGGRASFGTSLVVPLLLAFLCRNRWKPVLAVAFSCAAIAYPISLVSAPTHDLYGFKSVLSRIATDAGGDAYSSGRLDIWTRMLAQSLEMPVFGHGQIGTLDLFREMPQGYVLNAHNAIIHILHAWGLLGVIVFAVGLLPFLPTLRLRLKARPTVAWPALATLLALAVTSALDGTLFYNQPLFLCALCIAILAAVPATPLDDGSPSNKGNARRGADWRVTGSGSAA